MRHEERQAAQRETPEQRVMAALWMAPEGQLELRHIESVTGLARLPILHALDTLIASGTVKAVGDLKYRVAG